MAERESVTTLWQPIETVPNSIFDVLAKYWEPSMDMFLYKRFADCVLVNKEIMCGHPMSNLNTKDAPSYRLLDFGFKPTHWIIVPHPANTDKIIGRKPCKKKNQ